MLNDCASLKELKLNYCRAYNFPARNLFGTSPVAIRILSDSSNLRAISAILKHVLNSSIIMSVDNVHLSISCECILHDTSGMQDAWKCSERTT